MQSSRVAKGGFLAFGIECKIHEKSGTAFQVYERKSRRQVANRGKVCLDPSVALDDKSLFVARKGARLPCNTYAGAGA